MSSEDSELHACANPECVRYMHWDCFIKAYPHGEDHPPGGGIFCTKACQRRLKSRTQAEPLWTNDGKDGPDDPMTSERLLVDWLTTEGNYKNLWKGGNCGGKSQTQVAKDIADYINSCGVRKERNGKQVSSKIGIIMESWKAAYDFANTETGAGLQENDVESFNDAVKKKCKYYFDLVAASSISSNELSDSSFESKLASLSLLLPPSSSSMIFLSKALRSRSVL